MSKLFVGCDVPQAWGKVLQAELKDILGKEGTWDQHNFHITFQWCGTEITDEDADLIHKIWEESMAPLKVQDMRIQMTKEFALFGKEHNLLVVKCKVSEAFEDAVERAREAVRAKVKAVPESDFKFSPHVTLGESTHLPTAENAEKALAAVELVDETTPPASFRLFVVHLWRDGYESHSRFHPGLTH